MYGGDVTLYYNDKRHRYEVDISDEGIRKKYTPSATGIKGKLDKSAALVPWAVNSTLDAVESYWLPGLKYHKSQIRRALRKAKEARFNISKDATDIGSDAHDWLEQYILLRVKGVQPELVDDYEHTAEDADNAEHILFLPQDPPVRSAIDAFLTWEQAHEITWLWSEKKVYSRKHHFAGTADAAAIIDGKLYLIDFKTSKRIYMDYFLQLAAYAKALEEMEETGSDEHKKFDRLLTIRVPKDGGAIELMDNENIEFYHFSTRRTYKMKLTIARLYKYFLGLRQAYEFAEEAKDLYGDVVK